MSGMHVVSTAGHVDHGKSALVRALTGMEPDRWEEERRRGLTLDLGFAWTSPSEADPQVAFVDVPGHERLVGNMLAGVGPVPAVLFVVAADQGWQPQSEEHLAILDALRVRHGLLAVTRSDLADPEPVRSDALARMATTWLGTVDSVCVSAVTGSGMVDLRKALLHLVGSLPSPDRRADVRLWVDRAFTVRGRGTVVTGTLQAGTIRMGDHLALPGGGDTVRVRGIQSLKQERAEIAAVARVALNLHGPAAERIRRGDALLTPDRWITTELVDVRVRGDEAAALPARLTMHAGSAAVPVVVRPLGQDTARLTLGRPLPLRVGDVALLRDPGRHRVSGGLSVLDVRPPRLARRGAGRARAAELHAMTDLPDGAAEVRRRGLVRRSELAAMGIPPPPWPPWPGGWLAAPEYREALREKLGAAVARYAAEHPLNPGLPSEAARRMLDLPDRALVDALVGEPGGTPLRQYKGRIHGEAPGPELPDRVRSAVESLRRSMADSPFRAPEADGLAALGLGTAELSAAAATGALLKIADGVVLPPGADDRAYDVLARLAQPFTVSEARCALRTTRRVAVPLLEHLDRLGRTVRVDANRRRCRARSDGGGGRESNPPARDPRTPRF